MSSTTRVSDRECRTASRRRRHRSRFDRLDVPCDPSERTDVLTRPSETLNDETVDMNAIPMRADVDTSSHAATRRMHRFGTPRRIQTHVDRFVVRRGRTEDTGGSEACLDVPSKQKQWRTCVVVACASTWMQACTSLAATTDTLQNVPDALLADERVSEQLSKLAKSNKTVPRCTSKCVATCVRGGGGAPGLGPMSVRKAPVVFEEGFRTRGYCVRECTEICALQAESKTKR